jgi:iron(III) transport system substrate-binding protein
VEKLKTERAAGQYRADVVISGASTFLINLKPESALDPIEPALILPEVKDPSNWRRGLEFVDKDRTALVMTPFSLGAFMVNSNQVKPNQITAYRDLLDPQWRGRLLFHDPRISGNGQAAFTFLYQHKELGTEYLRALMGQSLVILRDTRQELDMLGQGRLSLCLGCSDGSAEPLMAKGVPLAMIGPDQVREGGQVTSGPGNVGLINRAPHPNAASVYLNWLLGKEGQAEYGRALGNPSGRADVSNDWVEPWKLPAKGYWDSYTEEALLEVRLKAIDFAKELLGE